jgi:large subunit ribosomal protein L28
LKENIVICDLFEKTIENLKKMSRVCQITGKKMMVGNNVSHSKKRTKRRFNPNLFDKKFYLAEEDRFVSLRVSAKGLRTINKKGLLLALKDAKEKGFITKY